VSGIRIVNGPSVEPITLTEAKNYLKVNVSTDDDLISACITAARHWAESFTGRSIAKKQYVFSLDAFPYFTDTITSQNAYPPSYYSLPRYSTTLWNYSQMIKLWYPPVLTIDHFKYIDPNGNVQTLKQGTDFIFDPVNEDCRIFTMPGQFWPPCLYTPNAVLITYTAGYDDATSGTDEEEDETLTQTNVTPPNQQPSYTFNNVMPHAIRVALLMLTSHFYFNRDAVVAGTASEVPFGVQSLLSTYQVLDYSPTRG
jgi:hypothetical protein